MVKLPPVVTVIRCSYTNPPPRPQFMCPESQIIPCDYRSIDAARWMDYAKAIEFWAAQQAANCPKQP